MEKEVKKSDIAGETFEDLEKAEMDQTQGQGDVNAETVILSPRVTLMGATKGIVCYPRF